MFYKLSLILFFLGLICLLIPIFISPHIKRSYSFFVGCNILSSILLIIAFVLREKTEQYDYNYALRTGKVVGGTVYASYPEMNPGLGWI